MDKGVKDLIDELREYAAPRKGELAGMLLEAANRLEELSTTWVTDREPTDDEVEYAGDCGFILCISGTCYSQTYDHAIVMDDNYYEEGRWYIRGCGMPDNITVHGWMLPPAWEE